MYTILTLFYKPFLQRLPDGSITRTLSLESLLPIYIANLWQKLLFAAKRCFARFVHTRLTSVQALSKIDTVV